MKIMKVLIALILFSFTGFVANYLLSVMINSVVVQCNEPRIFLLVFYVFVVFFYISCLTYFYSKLKNSKNEILLIGLIGFFFTGILIWGIDIYAFINYPELLIDTNYCGKT